MPGSGSGSGSASASGEDAASRGSPPKPDNLFVRFRQFTDDQISSLLQGIVGLPSAMSRNAPGSARWEEVDEDLRRRDELQVRQKELRDSELRRVNAAGKPGATAGRSSSQAYEDALHALPLYARFSPGQVPGMECLPDFARVRDGVGIPSSLASILSFDFYGNPSSGLHRFLGSSEIKTQVPSLFPYLFHSPYSPLILSTKSELSRISKHHFPYCHAFEDLLLASENRPMVPASDRRYLYEPFTTKQDVMPWFHALSSAGLLTKPAVSQPPLIQANEERISRCTKTRPLDATFTEQDMYNRFLQRATSANSDIPPDPFGLLFSLADEIEKGVKAQFPELEKALQSAIEEASSQIKGGRSRESIVEDIKAGRLEGGSKLISIFEELASNKTERARAIRSFSEDLFGVSAGPRPEQVRNRAEMMEETTYRSLPVSDREGDSISKDPSDSERVVSSSTTSEHHTNEDGSVERSVTVWMRFADGRETITTKSHVEEPKKEEGPKQSSSTPVKEAEQKQQQKGWFWN